MVSTKQLINTVIDYLVNAVEHLAAKKPDFVSQELGGNKNRVKKALNLSDGQNWAKKKILLPHQPVT